MIGLIRIKTRDNQVFLSLLPVVDEDHEGHRDDDEDTDADDDGREVVVDDPPALRGGLEVSEQGGGQAAAVARLQDVLADGVRVVDVTSQLARVHYLRLIVTHPGSANNHHHYHHYYQYHHHYHCH